MFSFSHLKGAILGCDDGLYVVSFKPGPSQNKPVYIIGLGAIYQLQIVRDLGIAVLIVGKERELCYIDVYDLESRLKQLQSGSSISAITSQQIEKVKGCHLFNVQKVRALNLLDQRIPLISLLIRKHRQMISGSVS